MPVVMSEDAGTRPLEPQTVEDWFVAYEAALIRYTHRIVRNADTSQEIVQETFMRLHAQRDTVEQPRAWLFRTAHNLALNHCRSAKKIVPLEFDTESPDSDPSIREELKPDEHAQRMEDIQMTRDCLETLKDPHRELIRLKFEEGLSYKEISKRTGLSTGNVGYLLHHALKNLAGQLANKGVRL